MTLIRSKTSDVNMEHYLSRHFLLFFFCMFLISFCLRPVVFSSFRTVRIQFENCQVWGHWFNCKLINVITWEEATITMLHESAFCLWFNRQIIHMMTCEGVLIVCSLGTSLVDVWNFYQSLDVRDILLSYLTSIFLPYFKRLLPLQMIRNRLSYWSFLHF